jgi:hypothetical protein
VTIEVVKAVSQLPVPQVQDTDGEAEDKSIFIRAKVDRDTVYVNQQVTWTLGFCTDGRVSMLRSPEYSPPTAEGFWVEDLPPQNNYYKTIGGRQYLVNEIKRGFFPTVPGEYMIGAARVDIVIDDFGRRNRDDLFKRPLRSFGFGKPAALSTEPVKITVLPLPARGRPANFSGLVGRKLELSLIADKQVVQVGDPINVTLQVDGEGNFKTMAAPKMPELDGFKMYESGATSNLFKKNYTVSGRKQSDYVLIPKVEGKRVIPSIELSYFDPEAGVYKMIETAPIHLEVRPGTQEEGRRIVFAGSGEDIEVLGKDISFIQPVPASLSAAKSPLYSSRALMAAHALPLLAVILSLAVETRGKKWLRQGPLARASRAGKEAVRRLDKATARCKDGRTDECYSLVSIALREYFADKMNVSASGLTFQDIDVFLSARNVPAEDTDVARSLLSLCDSVQYSPARHSDEAARETVSKARETVKRLEKGLR